MRYHAQTIYPGSLRKGARSWSTKKKLQAGSVKWVNSRAKVGILSRAVIDFCQFSFF